MDDEPEAETIWADPVSSRAAVFRELMLSAAGVQDDDLRTRALAMLDALIAAVKGRRTGELRALNGEKKG